MAIARALAVDPPVLLMDEPTASLDPRRAELGELLRALIAEAERLIIATHDEEFARLGDPPAACAGRQSRPDAIGGSGSSRTTVRLICASRVSRATA